MILLVVYLFGLVAVVVLLAYALRCRLQAEEFEAVAEHHELMAALAPEAGRG
ncbi:MAG: hypothetical protein JWN67_4997 [Actinomycetia bacterium]|nr:hypothetical protein [Actinomycetes bacterium]